MSGGADYVDDYATCARTRATVRIYHDDADPGDVSDALGLQPSSAQRKGVSVRLGRPAPPLSGWFLTSERVIDSRDLRRHVDWLLDRLANKEEPLERLRSTGWRSGMSCFWASAHGHGGPIFPPAQLARLAALGFELSLDIYFTELDDRPLEPGELTADFRRASRHWSRFGFRPGRR